MKKVLVLAPIFFPCPQSASQRISSFVQGLVLQQCDVTVITGKRCLQNHPEPSEFKNLLIYNFRCPRFLLSTSFAIVNPIILLLFLSLAIILAARRHVDVCLASVPAGETFVAGFVLSKLFKTRLVVDVRDMYPPPQREMIYMATPPTLNRWLVNFFKLLYRSSSKILCVDASVQRRLLPFGVSPERTIVIPNGADASIYKPRSHIEREATRVEHDLPLDKLIVVYAGALAWYYPVVEAIKGLKELLTHDDDVELLIISHAGHAREQQLVEELQLQHAVTLTGPFSVARTAKIIAACDVGLVVYRGDDYWRDMYGGKIFSYMSCGLPVLASGPPRSVIDELLSRYETGVFVGPPTPGDFAQGFSYFIENKRAAKDMGTKGRTLVEQVYDRRKLGLRVAQIICGLSE